MKRPVLLALFATVGAVSTFSYSAGAPFASAAELSDIASFSLSFGSRSDPSAILAGPRIDMLFRDAAMTEENYLFALGETVYVTATNLNQNRGYRFEAKNPLGVSAYLGPCKTGAATAFDSFAPNAVSGTTDWTWVLREWRRSDCSGDPNTADSDDTIAFNVASATVYIDSALTTPASTFSSVPLALSGTVSMNVNSAILNGTGTAFLSQISVGQVIMVPHSSGYEVRRVTAIASNTSLSVDKNWASTAAGKTASRLVQAYVKVEGAVRNVANWKVSWYLPNGQLACENNANAGGGQDDRPGSGGDGVLPATAPQFLEYVPSDSTRNWNDPSSYEVGPCPLFSGTYEGQWRLGLWWDATHNTTLNLDNAHLPALPAPVNVLSIARAASNPTNAAQVAWTVTFDKSVTGVDESDFALSSSALSGAPAITSVTGGGAVYTVTAGSGAGTGILGLNLVDNDTILDAGGRPLGGTGASNGNFTGEAYSLDRTLTPQIIADNKIYDGTTAAIIATRSFTSNLTVTENVSVSGGTAAFADRNVGTGKTVAVTGLSLSGGDASKYVLSSDSATGSADITSRPITVIAVTNSKPYDGTTNSSGVPTITPGLAVGDTPGFTQVFDNPNPGPNKVISPAGSVNDGNSGLNYEVTFVNNTGTIGWSISGRIAYGTPNTSTTKFVPGVDILHSGTPETTASIDGRYDLVGIDSGPQTVTPSKSGDINGITSFDASLVARHVVALITLTPNQQIAGDASNNGALSSFDASMIARFVVGRSGTGITGQWKFGPESRNYAAVESDLGSEDFDAFLIGDVSGNWTPPGAFAGSGTDEQQNTEPTNTDELLQSPRTSELVNRPRLNSWNRLKGVPVTLSEAVMESKDRLMVTIPVTTGDTTGKGIVAYDFRVDFDPDLLQPVAMDTAGTLSSGWTVTINPSVPGQLIVSGFGIADLAGSGTLLNLRFNVVGTSSKKAPFTLGSFIFNEGFPAARLVDR